MNNYQQQHQQQQQQQHRSGGGVEPQQQTQYAALHHQQYNQQHQSPQEGSQRSLNVQPQNSFDRQQQQEQEMWAQKINYQHQQEQQQQRDMYQQQQQNQHYSSDLSSKNRRSSNAGGAGAGMQLDLNHHSTTPTGSQRNGSAKNASHQNNLGQDKRGGGFFHQQQNSADVDSSATAGHESGATSGPGNENIAIYLNKTQQVASNNDKDGSNERTNRMNLYRSNHRQRSSQQDPQQQQTSSYYDASKHTAKIGHGNVDIAVKNKKSSDLDVVYYQQNTGAAHPDSRLQQSGYNNQNVPGGAGVPQDQFYQQKISNADMLYNNFKQSQTQKGQNYHQEQDASSLNDSKQQLQQMQNSGYHKVAANQNQVGTTTHQSIDQQHRRGSDATGHGTNHKKKVQPPQPRNREESTSRRNAAVRNGHNKSSETTNSYDQSSQNSSQGLQQTQQPQMTSNYNQQQRQQQQQQPQPQQVDSDKFSQLVCQVPAGSSQPQMASNAQAVNPQIQVQDGASGNFSNNYLLGPQRASEAGRKTLVLDLDETLVHSSFKPVDGADIMLPVEIDGQICTIYVLVRPFVAQFLKNMHKIYELVIFTASLSKYAEPLMQHLDPGKMCSYLLFREHCTYFNNAYVKDLTRLGRPMKDVIIVDNSPVAYLFQPENAMPAVSWYEDPSDTELNRIDALLEKMNQEEDVRKIIRTVISNNKIDPRQEALYMAAASHHRRDKSQRIDRRTKTNKLTAAAPQVSGSNARDVQQPSISLTNNKHESSSNQQQHSQVSVRNTQQQSEKYQSDTNMATRGNVFHPPKVSQQQSSSYSAVQGHSSKNSGSNSTAVNVASNLQQQQQQQQQQKVVSATTNTASAQPQVNSHSRYDSSDTRQRNAALITEEINQRKRGGQDNLNMEIVLSNVQKLSNQSSDLQYQTDVQKNMKQNQNDIQQAYQHHKNQIMQLKNEIAALKSQQGVDKNGKTPKNAEQQQEQVQLLQQSMALQQRRGLEAQQPGNSNKVHAKTTTQGSRAVHQQIGDGVQKVVSLGNSQQQDSSNPSVVVKSQPGNNKGQKQRESSRRKEQQQQQDQQEQQPGATQNIRTKPHSSKGQQQQRQSYKILSTNEIQLVNYLKNNNGGGAGGGTSSINQRNSINTIEKKQLVVRESVGNNSQLHNTKQIIKLIKKSEGHSSNYDVMGVSRQNYQPIDASGSNNNTSNQQQHQPQSSQPNIQATSGSYNHRAQHPATTKSQTKQHFAFAGQSAANTQQEAGNNNTRQTRQSQQSQPFSGQINMISSTGGARGQQASRQSSKTTKNYSTSAANTAASNNASSGVGNIRTSYSSSKHGAAHHPTNKAAQSSLQAHERISSSGVVGSNTQTKRSSSVKTSSQSHHHGHRKSSDKDHHHQGGSQNHVHRKGNNSATHQDKVGAYSNLAAYDQPTHHRRERGSSAQPLYDRGNGHGPSVNPILVTNIVSRSSSTTNKNKKANSISGAGNFHNLVLNGSHSTKHSTQQNHHGHNSGAHSILHASQQQRGGSQDRHQKGGSSQTRQPTRLKSASNKNSNSQQHGSDSKEDHHYHHKTNKGSSSNQQQYSLKQQQENLQRMQQMQQNPGSGHSQVQQQLSATQRISPGAMLSLAQYQPATSSGQNSQQLLNSSLTPSHHQQQAQAIVKQNLKDIQVQDILRLTQNTNGQAAPSGYFGTGISSTRNQKQATQIGGHHSVQQQHETDDFLKKVKLQQQPVKISKDSITEIQQRRNTEKQKNVGSTGNGSSSISIMHQEVGQSKSSQGHQSMGAAGGLTINSPKYAANGQQINVANISNASGGAASRDQQKILNDIMNMSSMQREQKSGSAATSYASKQVQMTSSGNSGTNGHQIKKIRISSNQQSSNGRISGQSNQSANHKTSGLKRGDSNHSRGSHSSAIHQVIRTNGSGAAKTRDQARQAQLFNQTMKLKSSNARGESGGGAGILSLLGDMNTSDSQDKDFKNQTAADLFLKSHNEDQFSQTQYIGGSGTNVNGGNNNSQLREVTRHFYNQLSSQGPANAKKQQ